MDPVMQVLRAVAMTPMAQAVPRALTVAQAALEATPIPIPEGLMPTALAPRVVLDTVTRARITRAMTTAAVVVSPLSCCTCSMRVVDMTATGSKLGSFLEKAGDKLGSDKLRQEGIERQARSGGNNNY